MKIILSPAKTLNLQNMINSDWCINGYTQRIVELLESIVGVDRENLTSISLYKREACVSNSSRDKLQKLLKISDKLVDESIEYICGFSQSKTYKATEMYNGMAYKSLDISNLDENARNYLNEHLLILSALYGIVKSDELIKPYRLDFNCPMKVEQKSLKKFWIPFYNSYIDSGETVINLASNEFSDLFDRSRYKWYDFDFFELDDKIRDKRNKKRHSTISKKGRGRLLREMAINDVRSVDGIQSLQSYGEYFEIVDSKVNL